MHFTRHAGVGIGLAFCNAGSKEPEGELMQATDIEDAIRRIELVEDDVLRFIEDHPQVIKSRNTLDVLQRLKAALDSLRVVRGKLGGMKSAAAPLPGPFQYRILKKPH